MRTINGNIYFTYMKCYSTKLIQKMSIKKFHKFRSDLTTRMAKLEIFFFSHQLYHLLQTDIEQLM